MGWFFKKKKKLPPLNFPGSELGKLNFPRTPPPERVIEPDEIKEAAGFEKKVPPSSKRTVKTKKVLFSKMPAPLPLSEEMKMEELPDLEESSSPRFPSLPEKLPERQLIKVSEPEPLYIKMDVYQRILGEFSLLKSQFNKLNDTYQFLEKSEYNEEQHVSKLKRAVRLLHDRLLQVDKLLFKT